jgi:hypothetical protein
MLMEAVKEYAGPLVGGPNDGEFAEATVMRIPVASTSLLWLDGVGTDTKAVSTRIMGVYVWDPDRLHFKWRMEGIGYNSRGT